MNKKELNKMYELFSVETPLKGGHLTTLTSFTPVSDEKGLRITLNLKTKVRENYKTVLFPSNFGIWLSELEKKVGDVEFPTFNGKKSLLPVLQYFVEHQTEFMVYYGTPYFSDKECRMKYNGVSIVQPETVAETVEDSDNAPWTEAF